MVAERRAARLVTTQEAARQSAHPRNMAVAREAMVAAGGRHEEEDRERAAAAMTRASQRHNRYPFPSFVNYEDAERRRRRRQVFEDRMRRHQHASNRRSNSEAGPSTDSAGTSDT
jgi:hypothetical protein